MFVHDILYLKFNSEYLLCAHANVVLILQHPYVLLHALKSNIVAIASDHFFRIHQAERV